MESVLVGAFGAHWEEWVLHAPSDEAIPPGAFLSILGGLLTTGVLGLVGTLAKRR